jgi:Tol biopolymer transport system component
MFNFTNQQTNVKLSPDGQKVFFVTITDFTTTNAYASIYSCNIDGSNLREVAIVNDDNIELGGAY